MARSYEGRPVIDACLGSDTPTSLINPLHSVDVVYVIGGGTEKADIPPLTYEVIGVNIATKEVFEPSDVIHAVYSPAAAASANRLIVCGGLETNGHVNYCRALFTEG